jgi:hypothetical protein
MSVAVARQHFKHTIAEVENGDVERTAAVGSLMIRSTLSPAISPASLVAVRWESLK